MFLDLFMSNLLTIPVLMFICGILASLANFKVAFSVKINTLLTFFLLFSVGLKGGSALIEHSESGFFLILVLLVIWGLIQPFFSYLVLRKFTKLDSATAAAVAACFGSISVMTFIAGSTFLDKLEVQYDGIVIAALAIMEVPAIISGLFISKLFNASRESQKTNLLREVVFNKTVLMIVTGMLCGAISSMFQWHRITLPILILFKPFLCVFLFSMGVAVGKHRGFLRQFSWSLSLFGLYMPFIGALFGICLSYFLGLDAGTGTLIAILTASASYIAVPAAMRIALPEAKEAIYLPLALGITFPFNVMIGIPIYYCITKTLL